MTSQSSPSTIEEVARRAGVSRSTVSRVLNGVATVDPKMRRAVDEAVRATGYVPNLAARSLVTRRTNSVALVISEPASGSAGAEFLQRIFSDPYFGRVTAGAQQVLRATGVHLVVVPADREAHDFVLSYLRQGHVDGVLFLSGGDEHGLPHALHEMNVPVVLSHQPTTALPVSWVDADQAIGGRLAAEHLGRLGRRRAVVLAGPPEMRAARERLAGFRAAAAEAGIAVTVEHGDFTARSGAAGARKVLTAHPDADAVFAVNDLMAEAAVRVLQDGGRRVPDDVAVVGFDDSATATEASPPLTTVRQPVEDMAGEMARLLLDRIRTPDQPPRGVMFTPSLVVRATA
ncbi:LacI family DNA-binding transcriptional regulator [Cellulomonas sp. PhB150]|uniref:LacI family DNA-binding transcriptional regulator n=1 Tax=Cellulomonas sp. PhB150 TaxID=2485188 RepID=UPI000F4700DC|nr:LacI family DNA-binding transcriptional regulator [Cellulomonas sp. PhB150]ROS31697.1 LacI family transcriptional regulator [Cellulomonas sp. PhB150]